MLDRDYVVELSKRKTDICDHLIELYSLVVLNDYKLVVELGAGQSTYVLCAAVNKTGGYFYSVDLLKDAHLRGFAEGEGILENEPRYHFLLGDDTDIVKTWIKPIDFLFIDSSHQYEHTKAELDAWGKFVVLGGTIACHDTRHKYGHAVGCRPAVDEFVRECGGKFSSRTTDSCGGLTILKRLNARALDL